MTLFRFAPGAGCQTRGSVISCRHPGRRIGVRAWLLPVLAVVGLLVFGAGTASAHTLPDAGNRVRVSTPETITAVGVSEHITAGQGRGPPVSAAGSMVATGVAAETGTSAAARLATAGGCFIAGTEVLMADGTRKAVEDVKVGDKVASYDPVAGRQEAHVAIQRYVHVGVATFDVVVAGQRVTTTGEHPFYVVGRGWTPAKNLKNGDRLLRPDRSTASVDSVVATGRAATVYNFEVETRHDYYVRVGKQWVLVHNNSTPLQLLHSPEAMSASKSSLEYWGKQGTDDIVKSLAPEGRNPLVVKPSGVVMDGNTRISVLQSRGYPVNDLPRVPYSSSTPSDLFWDLP